LIFFVLTCHISSAQQFEEQHFEQLKFRNIGPAGMSGRVTAIDVDLSNPHRIYVGTASGGVWLSENGGTSWDPIFDKMDCLAIGSVKINQTNPDEIWVGTGEGNPRNSLNTGRGIYKSIDGGKSWHKMGLEKTKTIHRIVINEHNSKVVYAAALGSPWGPNQERGVFKTIDGGKTWSKILYVNDQTGAADMVMDPDNPNKLIVAMWEHSRKPWFFTSGGKGSGMHITYDGGESWKQMSDEDGLPKGDLGRIGLAIAPSKPDIIYALIEAKENGLYKSIDGGKKWKLVSKKNIGNRPFYYSELYVDTKNENRIFNIYTYVSKSEDGGKTFEQIMDYGNDVHPDHHAFWIHPDDPNYMIGGNDGGMTISRDGGKNWTFVNNLPVGQFYHVNIDNDFPYNIYGGMQDNGSWVGPSSVFKRGGIRNADFREISFGDGFDVVPFRSNSRYGYSMSQQGYVGFYDRETGYSRSVRPLHPDTTELRFNWNSAIAQDPFDDCGVYFGSQFVHHSIDCGESWKIISPDLTSNDPDKQKSGESGGLTYDATGAENHTTILAVAPSSFDKNTIWAGTDDGKLQLTRDGGESWTDLYGRLPSAPNHGWIAQIELSSHNEGEAFVVVNNYRQNDYRPYTYHTTDFGKTWRSLINSTISEFVLCVVQDPEVENLLFLGADNGLFVSFDKGQTWNHFKDNFPQVQVSDLKIQAREKDLVIGTFGRSFWVLDDIEVLRGIAKNKNLLDQEFDLLASNDGYLLSYRSVDGVRFKAQGDYTGENDNNRRLTLNAWKKPSEKPKEKQKKKDGKKGNDKKGAEKKNEDKKDSKLKKDKEKVYLTVLDSRGDTVRNFSHKLKDGFNRFGWRMNSNGVEGPSKNERKKDRDPVSGGDVLPGVYKIVAVHNDIKDSINVTVHVDPRRSIDIADLKSKRDASLVLNKEIEAAHDAYELIRAARKSIDMTKSLLKDQEDSIVDQFKSIHKDFAKELDSLEVLFFGEVVKKGIKRSQHTLNGDIWTARRYISASTGSPKGTAEIAINKLKQEVSKVVNGVNDFFDEDWDNYKDKVAKLQPQIFKKLKKVDY
jgi:photosystem II stability/assembly factor-like uncharacterized protein